MDYENSSAEKIREEIKGILKDTNFFKDTEAPFTVEQYVAFYDGDDGLKELTVEDCELLKSSPLATLIMPAHPNNCAYYKRVEEIDTITIHCTGGNGTAKDICRNFYFRRPDRKGSCNYAVGKDGSIAICVPECFLRAYTTGGEKTRINEDGVKENLGKLGGDNDKRAVTIEVSSTPSGDHVTDEAWAATLELVIDICKRNAIKRLVWSDNMDDRIYHKDGCNMTVHRDYANKGCPGEWIYTRLGELATSVNSRLSPVVIENLNIKDITSTKMTASVNIASMYLDEFSKYIWYYELVTLKDDGIAQSKILNNVTFNSESTFAITDLIPNTPYFLEVFGIEHAVNTEKALRSRRLLVCTKQDYPLSVKNVSLTLTGNTLQDTLCNISFSPPENWGEQPSGIMRGYRVSLVVNGSIASYSDSLIAASSDTIIEKSVKLLDLADLFPVNYHDNIQIGIQSWVKDFTQNKLFFDSKFPKCSPPITLLPDRTKLDKVFIKIGNAAKQGVFYLKNNIT